MQKLFLMGVSLFMWGASCKDVTSKGVEERVKVNNDLNELCVGFYNVENIYDTENDPKTLDDDFTPTGKYEWSAERYKTKLDRTSEVLSMMSVELPDVVGLCEIENRKVLEDLISTPRLIKGNYGIVHYDSPDERGIDVAFLYKKSSLEIISSENIKVILPVSEDPNTRDVLYIKAKAGGEDVHFFVNHWPSRRGGQQESEPSRIMVAQLVKERVESILSKNAESRVLLMGDFNDYPTDKSIREVLGARGDLKGELYNTVDSLNAQGIGSYWYKGAWNALDQIILSKPFIQSSTGWILNPSKPVHFINEEKLLFRDKEGVARPNRTFAGDDYKGGYSDHLPVVGYFIRK